MQTIEPDQCVPQSLLLEVTQLQHNGKSLLEAVKHLKPKTGPEGYHIHPWTEGSYFPIIYIQNRRMQTYGTNRDSGR